jgi:hypothetical protein
VPGAAASTRWIRSRSRSASYWYRLELSSRAFSRASLCRSAGNSGCRNKPASQKEANRAHARLRAPGERAHAQLKTWRILRKLRCCPWRAGQLAKAIHVLQARETGG